nr:MAG TPA: hypothetical protein [Caudoviricetes sp.]
MRYRLRYSSSIQLLYHSQRCFLFSLRQTHQHDLLLM